ncbi:MAG: GntR family transcriptional regulator [Spirochaetes bacterium]|nr:GntR family transcriptional regulator [Spirochaetota bacterium]
MNKIDNKNRKYLEIAEQLKNDIISGKYKIGNNIPSIRKLAQKYNINQLTMSKVTAYLSSLGFLNIIQGSGCKVVYEDNKFKKHSIVMLVNKEKKNLELPINYFFKDVYMAFLMIMNNKNYNATFISYQNDDSCVNKEFSDNIKNVDGFIILGDLPLCYYKYLEKNDIPVVLIDKKIPENYKSRIGTINIEMKKFEEAINYLISLGHIKMLYSIDNEIHPGIIFNHRLNIIKNTLDNWPGNIPFKLEIFKFSPNNKESESKLLDLINKGFSASLCYNDISALNLYSLLNSLNIKIPNDFSVIGIDDIFPAKLAIPPLTTLRVDSYKLAMKAINILEHFASDNKQKKIFDSIESEFIIRKSTYIKK